MEEAFALRPMDMRRVEIAERAVTQVAVHHAVTDADGLRRTKAKQSVRIVAVMDPFGERLWTLSRDVPRGELICSCDPGNQNKRWRGYFTPLPNPDSEDADERRRAERAQGHELDLPWPSRGAAAHPAFAHEGYARDAHAGGGSHGLDQSSRPRPLAIR
ncbi:MAG: hypothetical protein Q4B54_11410 [Coriobacteriales bacterium]|nr:hypothetical protein [Coriobacteriales bacterium]